MKHSGSADLPLYSGAIPPWLFERMVRLSRAITEAILADYGQVGFLRRLSDPFWFQSFGAVIGMDWNSSGVTTAVTAALRKALAADAASLGLFVCGGKGKQSLQTPAEPLTTADRTGLDGGALVRASKLSAKVDNTAVQDGFQLYLHSFVVSKDGDWTVIQQGMQPKGGMARRYHWHSGSLSSFVLEPHTAVCGEYAGPILNLVAREAAPTQQGIVEIIQQAPETILQEARRLRMPQRPDLRGEDMDLKRLGSVLWLAGEAGTETFEDLLLLKGVGPRTLQSLTLVSEVIHGTPSRFDDPARFSFAHGGKGGRPFPVPVAVYDETITTLQSAVERAKLGQSDKQDAIRKLSELSQKAEAHFTPAGDFDALIEQERRDSWKYGGRTARGAVVPTTVVRQGRLFDE